VPTVNAVLAKTQQRCHFQVIVTRGGAGRTGENTVIELSLLRIPVTFIDDTAAGLYVPKATKVIIGADRICADGMVVNGVGTYLVSLAAKNSNVPVYICADTFKFDPRVTGNQVDLEEKAPSIIIKSIKLPGSTVVKNPYFDLTPSELVTGVVTEQGIFNIREVLELCRKSA